MNKTFIAIATLIGTIIGAGFLGIPFVVMRSGFFIGSIIMILIAIIITIINLYLGEISLRTKTNHQLTGYAELYLGKKGKLLMFIAFSFGIYSALLAYLVGEADSLSFLFFQNTQHSLLFGIIFWLSLTIITLFGIEALKNGEELGVILIIIMMLSISILYWNQIDSSNLTYNNPTQFFVPFGVILFAFLGFAAIPEIERILNSKKSKKQTKKIILVSNLLVLLVYLIFTAIVLGSKGQATPAIATLALGRPFIILGIITMFTSYLALTTALVNTFKLDFHISKIKAWIYTISLPLILFLALNKFRLVNFTKILGIGGVISGGLTAILILLMVKNAKKTGNRKPEYTIPYSKILTIIIVLILSIATFLEIMNLFI